MSIAFQNQFSRAPCGKWAFSGTRAAGQVIERFAGALVRLIRWAGVTGVPDESPRR